MYVDHFVPLRNRHLEIHNCVESDSHTLLRLNCGPQIVQTPTAPFLNFLSLAPMPQYAIGLPETSLGVPSRPAVTCLISQRLALSKGRLLQEEATGMANSSSSSQQPRLISRCILRRTLLRTGTTKRGQTHMTSKAQLPQIGTLRCTLIEAPMSVLTRCGNGTSRATGSAEASPNLSRQQPGPHQRIEGGVPSAVKEPPFELPVSVGAV